MTASFTALALVCSLKSSPDAVAGATAAAARNAAHLAGLLKHGQYPGYE